MKDCKLVPRTATRSVLLAQVVDLVLPVQVLQPPEHLLDRKVFKVGDLGVHGMAWSAVAIQPSYKSSMVLKSSRSASALRFRRDLYP
jgi:hypothetical protein